MNMDPGNRFLDGATDIDVGVASVFGMDAALQTDLGRSPLPRFHGTANDLVQVENVGTTAQVLVALSFRERTELAMEIADVGVINVPRDHVRDDVSIDLPAHVVGRRADRREAVRARGKQRYDFLLVEVAAGDGAIQHPAELVWPDTVCFGSCRLEFRNTDLRPGRPRITSGETVGIDGRTDAGL